MYDRILVPTDGSQPAEAAARYGIGLADAFDASVHIVSVVDTRMYSDEIADVDARAREQRAALEDQAQDAVTAIEDIIEQESEIAYTSAIEYGVPYDEIASIVTEQDIDLSVMGTHGRSGLERVIVGSITERVVRTSEVPVLAVPPNVIDQEFTGYDSILIPTDGSPAAKAAVDHGLSVAEQFDATVHILSVVVTSLGLLTPSDTDREDANEAVKSVAEMASQRGIEVTTHVEEGIPNEQIQTVVTERGIDLVTMGTHGRSGLNRYFIGSITEKVLRTSDAPVITVRLTDPE